MIEHLRAAGMLRRCGGPDADLLPELFRTAATRLACPGCGVRGLAVREPVDDADDEAWGMARRCDGCSSPIPRERLEALPDTRLCAACQAGDERGQPGGPAEYCPKCGSVMTVRQSRGAGLARYVLACPSCRR